MVTNNLNIILNDGINKGNDKNSKTVMHQKSFTKDNCYFLSQDYFVIWN